MSSSYVGEFDRVDDPSFGLDESRNIFERRRFVISGVFVLNLQPP